MDEQTPVRESALAGHLQTGHFGSAGTGVTIAEIRDLSLWQLAVWPDSVESVASQVARDFNLSGVPGFGEVNGDASTALMRIEPLKFWVFGAQVSSEDSALSVVLDLSHSRTHIRLTGPRATSVLNSFLPLDLRQSAFPMNRVASSAIHHVGVTLWHSDAGYDLFVPRGFAVSVWELLYLTALQYGVTVE